MYTVCCHSGSTPNVVIKTTVLPSMMADTTTYVINSNPSSSRLIPFRLSGVFRDSLELNSRRFLSLVVTIKVKTKNDILLLDIVESLEEIHKEDGHKRKKNQLLKLDYSLCYCQWLQVNQSYINN